MAMAQVNDVKNLNGQKITMGGKLRTIKYDLNAYAELENRYGSVETAMAELKTGKIGSIKVILWAGLIHEEANIDEITGEPTSYNMTPYEVGSWIDTSMIGEVTDLMTRALTKALPEEEKEQKVLAVKEEIKNNLIKIAKVVYTEEDKKALAELEEEKKG
jgi:hypothetical protein